MIRVRVSPEEKAAIEQAAGSMQVSAYIRSCSLPPQDEGKSSEATADTDVTPVRNWGGRVRQLMGQGLPRMAAEKIADQELR